MKPAVAGALLTATRFRRGPQRWAPLASAESPDLPRHRFTRSLLLWKSANLGREIRHRVTGSLIETYISGNRSLLKIRQ